MSGVCCKAIQALPSEIRSESARFELAASQVCGGNKEVQRQSLIDADPEVKPVRGCSAPPSAANFRPPDTRMIREA